MEKENKIVFSKKNYKLMIIGLLLFAFGFVLLSLNNNTIDTNSIFYKFSALKLTISPLIITAGIAVLIVAIFKK